MPSTAPQASSSHSEISRAKAVASLDSENIPIPYGDLAGAIGIALPGLVLLVLFLMERIPPRDDKQPKPLSPSVWIALRNTSVGDGSSRMFSDVAPHSVEKRQDASIATVVTYSRSDASLILG
jgi:hypothetical protein